jgi:DNA-binding response OmpR family regulator
VTKEELRDTCAARDEAVSPNVLEVYISRLRTKLEPTGVRIRTVRGFGYLLDDRI